MVNVAEPVLSADLVGPALDSGPFDLDRLPAAPADKVMVMAEDERIRTNRLALLQEIKGLFRDIADFAKIAA